MTTSPASITPTATTRSIGSAAVTAALKIAATTQSVGLGVVTLATPSRFTATAQSVSVSHTALLAGRLIEAAVAQTQGVALARVAVPARFAATANSIGVSVAPVTIPGRQIRVREMPPLALSWDIADPVTGQVLGVWTPSEHDPAYVASAESLGTAAPGGFDQATVSLPRDIRRDYPDLKEFGRVTARGMGGNQIAYQGRMEDLPDTYGDKRSVTPLIRGYQAALTDVSDAREIFVDLDLTSWQAPSVQRRINLLNASSSYEEPQGATTDQTTGQPLFITQLTGAWSQRTVSEAWYDAKGLRIGSLYYAWKVGAGMGPLGSWEWYAVVSTDDVATTQDATANMTAAGPATGSGTKTATAARYWAYVQLVNGPGPAGVDGLVYPLYWTVIAVYGNHGLPLYGTNSATDAQGILASDALSYAVAKWAPSLAQSFGGISTIIPSSFVVPQATFTVPTTVAEMQKTLTGYELLDWFVWEGPTWWLNPRGQYPRKKTWLARVGPSQLAETGLQAGKIYNGCVVTWTDVAGLQRTATPDQYPQLFDDDPTNPATAAGIERYGPEGGLQLGTDTLTGALQKGQTWLIAQRALDTSGEAQFTGVIPDDKGIYWPTWMMRGGDDVIFTDARDTSPRRIVSTSYDGPSRTNSVHLDQPPDSMQALLERFQIEAAAVGL